MACVACAWRESVNPSLLSQDTQKISFSSAAFQLQRCFRTANTGLQPQGEINPSGVKAEKSHKKSGLRSVLRSAAQGLMSDASSALTPALSSASHHKAATAAGHELPFLSKAISWQSCCGHLTDASGEPRGDEGGDIIAAAKEKCR